MTSRSNVLPFQIGTTADLRETCERAAVIELRAYKRARHSSAESLARELGCSPDSAARWLTGDVRIPGWVVKAVQILGGKGVHHASAPVMKAGTVPIGAAGLQAIPLVTTAAARERAPAKANPLAIRVDGQVTDSAGSGLCDDQSHRISSVRFGGGEGATPSGGTTESAERSLAHREAEAAARPRRRVEQVSGTAGETARIAGGLPRETKARAA